MKWQLDVSQKHATKIQKDELIPNARRWSLVWKCLAVNIGKSSNCLLCSIMEDYFCSSTVSTIYTLIGQAIYCRLKAFSFSGSPEIWSNVSPLLGPVLRSAIAIPFRFLSLPPLSDTLTWFHHTRPAPLLTQVRNGQRECATNLERPS